MCQLYGALRGARSGLRLWPMLKLTIQRRRHPIVKENNQRRHQPSQQWVCQELVAPFTCIKIVKKGRSPAPL
jgi:hypothetical protein